MILYHYQGDPIKLTCEQKNALLESATVRQYLDANKGIDHGVPVAEEDFR